MLWDDEKREKAKWKWGWREDWTCVRWYKAADQALFVLRNFASLSLWKTLVQICEKSNINQDPCVTMSLPALCTTAKEIKKLVKECKWIEIEVKWKGQDKSKSLFDQTKRQFAISNTLCLAPWHATSEWRFESQDTRVQSATTWSRHRYLSRVQIKAVRIAACSVKNTTPLFVMSNSRAHAL